MTIQTLIVGLCFTLLDSFSLIGQVLVPQGMKIKLEKLEYEVGETISLSFETNINVDSVVIVDLTQFEIIAGPNTSSTISKVNGTYLFWPTRLTAEMVYPEVLVITLFFP